MPRTLAALIVIVVLTPARSLTAQNQPPFSRSKHTAICTGSEMIIWGGGEMQGELNSGGRYNPATGIWTPTATNGAPVRRVWHTAIWTGSEMIIWGGFSNGFLNDGWRYNPTTDTWKPIATNGAPEARARHTAVWTGKEMIVWGGGNLWGGSVGLGTFYLDSGGRYNPATDTWTPISTNGAPVARTRHAAIWTGTEMIVWGGRGHFIDWSKLPRGSAYIIRGPDLRQLDSGGRYDPATDSWKPVAAKDAPPEREDLTAVWTGKEMIVWGRYNGLFLDGGGRYDPVHDSWLALSTKAAPDGRWDHTAVWTGAEMIIWGGSHGGSPLFKSGGRYNPATDSWVNTSTNDVPHERDQHTAVWTGREMIVWGGRFFGGLDQAARYDPATDTWMPAPPAKM